MPPEDRAAGSRGGWVFLDQNTPNPIGSGWFYPNLTDLAVPRSQSHSLFAASWAPSPAMRRVERRVEEQTGRRIACYEEDDVASHFPLVWERSSVDVNAWDVTRRYQRRGTVGEAQETVAVW